MNNHIINLFRRMLGKFMRRTSNPRLSLWRTLFMNFYFLPFEQARKFPIYVYGKMTVPRLNGKIIVNTPANECRKGMIKLNLTGEAPTYQGGNLEIYLANGKIIFEGETTFLSGSHILIYGNGTLTIGDKAYISNMVNIACCNRITIGNSSRVGHEVQLLDTNFHFTFGASRTVRRNSAPIELGHHCWIGNRATIMKGVTLHPYTTISSNSLVNKSVTEQERSLIGGSPAKLLKHPFSRIFNPKWEGKLHSAFELNPDLNEQVVEEPLSMYD